MSPQAQTATASIPEVEKESSMSLPGMGTRAILFYITHETYLWVGGQCQKHCSAILFFLQFLEF